jgi:uncharacterized protein (DUF983 family)
MFSDWDESFAMADEDRRYPPISAVSTGLAGRCPRCGEGQMFSGFLTLAPRCDVCGLDFAFADSGDGPAVFVTLIAGFLVLGAALAIDVAYEPPLWIYIVIFLPLTLLVCLGLLRPLKGLLVASQYKNKAAPGRLDAP